jgi:hypothetical protein
MAMLDLAGSSTKFSALLDDIQRENIALREEIDCTKAQIKSG